MNNVNLEKKQYETYKLKRTDKLDLKFEGILLARAEGFVVDEQTDYIFTLYKTKSNKYICHSVCETASTTPTHHARVETDVAEVIDFFEQNNVAHELYDAAKIDNYELID